MLNIYLCEDDQRQLIHLVKLLEQYIQSTNQNAEVKPGRTRPEQLLEDLKAHGDCTSLFFLDVQLNGCGMDGFQLAKEIRKKIPKSYLVFLTSKEELAYEVFENEIDVLDYIVKRPEFFLCSYIDGRLRTRLERIFEKIEKKEQKKRNPKLVVECGSRLVEIEVKDIIYIQALKAEHQTEICCMKQRLTIRQTLKSLYGQLGEGFLYANKSCIVQTDKMREIDRNNRYIILQNGRQVEVAFREMKNVVAEFRNHSERKG